MKKRSEIEEKFKWDLSGYFKNDDEFKKEFDDLKSQVHFLDEYKGKLNNEKTILECLRKSEAFDQRLEVLYVYATLKTREDAANSFYQERATQVGSLLSQISTQTSFVSVEIKKNPNSLLEKLQKESEFKNYFKSILRNKKHILSEKEENYKAIGAAAGLAYNQIVGAESAVDINLAKQLNVVTTQLGVDAKKIVMNIGSAAAGYGYEYVVSTMDRIKGAALGQNDNMLQMPIITPVSAETWAVKEATASEADMPEWGSADERGIDMEVMTAAADLAAGSDAVILRHPESVKTISKLIKALA